MLLRIQSEESLRSYVERSLFLGWEESYVKTFEEISKRYLMSSGARIIASVMGWEGCYGFNRMLHHHTDYFRESIFKHDHDMSYSGKRYITSDCYDEDGTVAAAIAFCPTCVKDDKETKGFSYWRRLHCTDLKVCAKHNVLLETTCPFCGKRFGRKEHSLNVMWKTCGGRHLGECAPIKNNDVYELKKARIFEKIAQFRFHISEEAALSVLHKKLLQISPPPLIEHYGTVSLASNLAAEQLNRSIKTRLDACGRFSDDRRLIMEMLLTAYDDFSSFLDDLKSEASVFRPVESLWPTYIPSDHYSVQYISEDLSSGIGTWSCPYPSKWFSMTYTDGRAEIFPCCNFTPEPKKGHKLQAKRVREPLPAIPRMVTAS